MTTSLVVRLDSAGDVLLTGPAVRSVAAHSDRVVMLCGPRGVDAARMLPGVDEVVVWTCPWVVADPPPVVADDVTDVVRRIAGVRADRALVFTSFHQSPLPTALLLRLAGVPHVSAVSDDYPGALLDVRHRLPGHGLHEVERMLSLATAAGCPPGRDDDGRLAVRRPLPPVPEQVGHGPFVVVHPGASAPARAWSPDRNAALVRRLAVSRRVVVTGGPGERELTAHVAGSDAVDLGGRLDLCELAGLLDAADALVVGNTGPAHLAAAVGTPVVSLYAPTVPFGQWGPYRVPHVRLGDAAAPCRDSRATTCLTPGHPCLSGIDPAGVVDAVRLLGVPAPAPAREVAA
jgi:ADP-heptose:LPS heptosyltransferase